MGEGGPGGSGVSFLWTPVRNRRGRDRGLGAEQLGIAFARQARQRLRRPPMVVPQASPRRSGRRPDRWIREH